MAKSHGKNARILFAEFDLSSYFRSVDTTRTAALADATAFQDAWDKSVVGVLGGKVTLDGLFDGAADAVDEDLTAAFGVDATQVVTVAPADMAVGARCKLLLSRLATFAVKTPFNDVNQVSAEITADDKIVGGVSLHAVSGETATFNGTAVDNAASSANGALAHLHVPANTRDGSTTFKVQHSVDNSVWADLITFAAVGATTKTSERPAAVAGTVNRYLRVIGTLAGTTGSITPAVAVARL